MTKEPYISYPTDLYCGHKLLLKEQQLLIDLTMIEFGKSVRNRKNPKTLVKEARLINKHKIWLNKD